MISMLLDSFRRWRNRCRTCDAGGIPKFLLHNFTNIREFARYKTVVEYQCAHCGSLWVHPDSTDFLARVLKKELYAQWKSRPWIPTAKQADVLNSIGGVTAHEKREVFFPCEIRLPDGFRTQRAVLTATNGLCFGYYPKSKNVAILNEAHELSPSRFALPCEVRAAAMIAPEKRMGYAPVNVKDAKGNPHTLLGPMHFFEKNRVLGPEIRLDDSPHHGKNVVRPGRVEMYLICDLFDGAANGQTAVTS